MDKYFALLAIPSLKSKRSLLRFNLTHLTKSWLKVLKKIFSLSWEKRIGKMSISKRISNPPSILLCLCALIKISSWSYLRLWEKRISSTLISGNTVCSILTILLWLNSLTAVVSDRRFLNTFLTWTVPSLSNRLTLVNGIEYTNIILSLTLVFIYLSVIVQTSWIFNSVVLTAIS